MREILDTMKLHETENEVSVSFLDLDECTVKITTAVYAVKRKKLFRGYRWTYAIKTFSPYTQKTSLRWTSFDKINLVERMQREAAEKWIYDNRAEAESAVGEKIDLIIDYL